MENKKLLPSSSKLSRFVITSLILTFFRRNNRGRTRRRSDASRDEVSPRQRLGDELRRRHVAASHSARRTDRILQRK